ncbi:hypothetical protein GCM10010460_12310 [Microbacterium terrae]|nr:hypothetical protein GCM10017594_16930 [Microbacterium terrae]
MLLRIEPLGGPTPPEAPRAAQRRVEKAVGTIPVIPSKVPMCRRRRCSGTFVLLRVSDPRSLSDLPPMSTPYLFPIRARTVEARS